jgi:hypothetical protein
MQNEECRLQNANSSGGSRVRAWRLVILSERGERRTAPWLLPVFCNLQSSICNLK